MKIFARMWLMLLAVTILAAEPAAAQGRTTHQLPLTPENIHWGYYDASLEPVLTVRSGDRIYFENMLARGLERLRLAGIADARFLPSMVAVEEAETVRVGSHPLNGPIYVEGAEPGDVLEVRFVDIGFLTPYGVSGFLPGGGTLPTDFPSAGLRAFEIDTIAGTTTMTGVPGIVIPARPFFGSIGVAPPLLGGRINSTAPGYHVGNLDNKDLVEGTTLFLPVHAAGGLLSIGDGHAAQGDGEVSGTAIETSLYGTIEVVLHKDRTLGWPRAETPTHYISMGLDSDLDEAARIATREMVEFLVSEHGLAAGDAYILCSVALDLRVTQLVDGTKGIHGMLAKALFR
ncbi:MAG: acetamidase/formamidase family protein [Gemmatimonadetes bacterium]|nr:acetamidase/formamidase family protein [Gemmatimonadota bacterium]MDA1103248.1 acetamidase/formamidase family protein [Gemmatimonadota bacterium]